MKHLALPIACAVPLFIACDAAHAGSAELAAHTRRSFREMGVRKTEVAVEAQREVEVIDLRATEGIELPECSLPIKVTANGPFRFELAWKEPVRRGSITVRFRDEADELAFDVAYDH
jgi:hypothetical protein